MANGRNRGRGGSGRDAGGFVALPWSVMDCPAYSTLSHPARALLLEVARQYVRDNNGRMLLSMARLGPRGWLSAGRVQEAKQELLDAGFIFETVKGQRPHKASWYAATWLSLDKIPGFDEGAEQLFVRGAYKQSVAKPKRPPPVSGARGRVKKNATLTPAAGIERPSIAPTAGIESAPPIPTAGAIRPVFGRSSIPAAGNHLEMPSAGAVHPAVLPAAFIAPNTERRTPKPFRKASPKASLIPS